MLPVKRLCVSANILPNFLATWVSTYRGKQEHTKEAINNINTRKSKEKISLKITYTWHIIAYVSFPIRKIVYEQSAVRLSPPTPSPPQDWPAAAPVSGSRASTESEQRCGGPCRVTSDVTNDVTEHRAPRTGILSIRIGSWIIRRFGAVRGARCGSAD